MCSLLNLCIYNVNMYVLRALWKISYYMFLFYVCANKMYVMLYYECYDIKHYYFLKNPFWTPISNQRPCVGATYLLTC